VEHNDDDLEERVTRVITDVVAAYEAGERSPEQP
jgi:hypothetical protein